ncbi:MAG: cytochrome c biogenesis protein CcmG/thiol:disulfide interchange protein DsbE [Candidatus Aldehydirespiratoraceae bacterium]|jgi:cytochrome c biogenesis protein CcmG/thiol:disulfide interchange protein DsbE
MSDESLIDEVEAEVGTSRRKAVLAPFVALGVAIVMIGLVVLLIGAEPNDGNKTANTPLMDNPAPEAVGELGDGTPFDLSRRKGSWVVLNFFQSDCIPCRREHPELIEFVDQQRALDQGTEFYSVVFGDTKERVDRFFEERGGDWPVVFSAGDGMPASFGVNLVPETWIIDPQGVVRFRAITEVTADTLSAVLQQLQGVLR